MNVASRRVAVRARRTLAAALGLGLLAHGLVAHAHDFWIEPGIDAARTLSARVLVGEAPIADEEKSFESGRFARLSLVSRNGTIDLLPRGHAGAKPVVAIERVGSGELLFVADRTPVLIELPPAKFDAYLVEEGLGRIAEERARRHEGQKPGRERYTRYLKGLVQVGDEPGSSLARAVTGQRLEILVEGASFPLHATDRITVRVLFEGTPLVGAKVTASLRAAQAGGGHEPSAKDEAHVTDGRGAATFTVTAAGLVVVHLVHMRRCADSAGAGAAGGAGCADAEWESFWGSWTATAR